MRVPLGSLMNGKHADSRNSDRIVGGIVGNAVIKLLSVMEYWWFGVGRCLQEELQRNKWR